MGLRTPGRDCTENRKSQRDGERFPKRGKKSRITPYKDQMVKTHNPEISKTFVFIKYVLGVELKKGSIEIQERCKETN